MEYRFGAIVIVDTTTNKITILDKDEQGKKVVLYPGKKRTAEWVDVLIDDRPLNPAISTAKNLCRAIAQAFYRRPSV